MLHDACVLEVGASPFLQTWRNIRCNVFAGIDDLREKREEILKQLREDESEKAKITQELQILTRRLAQVNESIARKVSCARTPPSMLCPWAWAWFPMQAYDSMCRHC